MTRTAMLTVCILAAARAGAASADVLLHVSPKGNDAWTGQLAKPNEAGTNGPVATLKGARDAVRRLRAKVTINQPVRVAFAEGTYPLAEPVVFTPADSGTAESPVIYQAAQGATCVFTAGRKIPAFTVGDDGVWRARLPRAAEGKWTFEQLYVNGRWATRARTPNRFYHYMLKKVHRGVDPVTGKKADLSRRAFIARPEDIKPLLGLPAERLRDVVLVAYHSWAVSVHRVAAVDAETHRVVLTGDARWPLMRWGPSQRYHLENLRSALDEAGEWYLDRDGTLYYKPLAGEKADEAEVYAPVGRTFMRFAGEPSLGLSVRHITLDGLTFRHAGYRLPPEGHSDGQAAVSIGGAVELDAARNVTIRNCEISCVGRYAVWFHSACRDCRLEHTDLHDLGAGGVKIGHGWENNNPDRHQITRDITVDNCIIRRGARLFRGAIGVWIGHSSDDRVTHNDIADFFYSTVSVGWRWGYAHSVAKRNVVRFNHLHHTGWGVLSDMGGVYTLGPSKGTVVSDNHIHHVYSYDRYGRGGWGLYTDEGSSDIVFERNLVHHVKTGCFHQHYGRDNILRNNILALSMDGQIQRSRQEPHRSFVFERNIVYWKDGPLLTGRWSDGRFKMAGNLYYKVGGEPVTFAGLTLAQWQAKGHGEGSIIADPKFVDPEGGDFHLKEGSPAEKVGFQPFDYTEAGVYGDAEWTALAAKVKYPKVEFAPPPPPPPPLTFGLDFEDASAGAPPEGARVYSEKRAGAVVVADAPGGADERIGRRCLIVRDSPGLERAYNPHFYWVPRHTAGFATFSFDLRLSADTRMYHEWRGPGHPYRVGPSLWIDSGKLRAGKKQLAELPPDRWVHVAITAGIGPDCDGTWELTVTLPGEKPRTFDGLPIGHKDWKRLDWLGFSSMNTQAARFYLDNLKLSHAAKRPKPTTRSAE